MAPAPRKFDTAIMEKRWRSYFDSKLRTPAIVAQYERSRINDVRTIMVMPPPFANSRPQLVQVSPQADAMETPADENNYVRVLARRVKAALDYRTSPPPPLQLHSSMQQSRTQLLPANSTTNSSSSHPVTDSALVNNAAPGVAMFNFQPPTVVPPAMLGNITVVRDPWSSYVPPVGYSVTEQQQITNWNNVDNLFSPVRGFNTCAD